MSGRRFSVFALLLATGAIAAALAVGILISARASAGGPGFGYGMGGYSTLMPG